YPFPDIHKKISEFCQSNQIEVLDLLPVFSGKDVSKLRLSLLDQHPNADAYGLVSEAIAHFLITKGWIKDSINK
ncbi:MAG: hypothetical protein NUV86_12700, partial [Candidatus Scalindua sp.]|nr:hypothetical protein [Candidatus Scalindua sp.]MCR4344730.1 hypothetical protein [Candidatus Scalindua sp.]